jgi:hypothetical protein
MTLPVAIKKARDATDRFAQIIFVRQEHHAEVIRPRPVESGSLHQQHALLFKQFENEALVILDLVDFGSRRGNR